MKIDELQNRPHGLCITTVKLLLIILREVDADDPDVECDQVKIFTLLSIIKVFFNIRVQFILHEKRSVYLLSKSKMIFGFSLRRKLTVQQLLFIRNRSL